MVSTGGVAKIIVPYCKRDIVIDDELLLKGLMIIYNKTNNNLNTIHTASGSLSDAFYVAFYIHNRQTNGLQTVANAENGAFLLLPGLCYGTIICAK